MTRDDDGEVTALEVIDLEPEADQRIGTSRPWWTRSRGLTVGAVAIAVVAATLVAFVVVAHDGASHATHQQANTSTSQVPTPADSTLSSTQATVPMHRPRPPVLGRFYPVLDHTNTATLVLPSGRTLMLSGGVTSLIGGLGVTFGGSVTNQTCCPGSPLTFEIFHAAPSDLFETQHAAVVSTPLLMAPAQAKVGEDGLRGSEYRFGVLSTGDWTLIAFFLSYGDLFANGLLRGWHLRSTPNGAVLNVPANSTISTDYVTLGRTPDLTDREIMLAEHGCPAGSTKAQTLGEDATHAGWCDRGLLAQIFGPESYVGVAVSGLKVSVSPKA